MSRAKQAAEEVRTIVRDHPGVQGLALIGVLSAGGYYRADVAAAISYLYGHGEIDVDGEHCLWPMAVSAQ